MGLATSLLCAVLRPTMGGTCLTAISPGWGVPFFLIKHGTLSSRTVKVIQLLLNNQWMN